MAQLLRHRGLWYTTASIALLLCGLNLQSTLVKIAFFWAGGVFLYIGLGYFLSFTRLLFKNSKGVIPLPIKLILLPFFLGIYAYNWLARQRSDDPATQMMTPGLYIGRRILPGDIPDLQKKHIDAVLDVTAEFDALNVMLADTDILYRNIPIYDHSTPRLRDLHRAVALVDMWKRENKNVLVHCALGRGRSAMVILAYLIFKHPGVTIRSLLENVQAIRASIAPNFRQLRLLERYKQSPFVAKAKPSACVIVNPTAGSYRGDEMLEEIKDYLQPFYDLDLQLTTPEITAGDIARRAVRAETQLVVAGGGDGTVSAVASALVNTDVALGILPLGTANALANSLYGAANSSDLKTHCERMAKQRHRKIDTALCNGHTVILLSGIGIESGMISRADSGLKKRWGVLAYVAGAIQELSERQRLDITLRVDGNESEISTYSLIVANAAPITSILAQGGGEPVFDDGVLDVTWLEHTDDTSNALVSMIELLQSGLQENTNPQYVHHAKGRVIEFSAKQHIPVVIDGEVFEFEQVKIECRPQSLKVVA